VPSPYSDRDGAMPQMTTTATGSGVGATARALWTLSRPRGALWVGALPLLGLVWAHWDRALPLRAAGWGLAAVVVAWLLLNAGTLWLNAALDRDEGEVLFGRPAPVPPGIEGFGYAALAGCVAL